MTLVIVRVRFCSFYVFDMYYVDSIRLSDIARVRSLLPFQERNRLPLACAQRGTHKEIWSSLLYAAPNFLALRSTFHQRGRRHS